MRAVGFGRFETLQIRAGQLVLDPWPTTIRDVKFGTSDPDARELPAEFNLKLEVVQLFTYIRTVDTGVIRSLEIRHGAPLMMRLDYRPSPNGGRHHA
jgi:hypothetical protein